MQHPIQWFEIPVSDLAAAQGFYEAVFDCSLAPACCSELQMAVFPHAEQAVGGALVLDARRKPAEHGTLVYLDGGADLAGPLGRVVEQGGRVVLPKTPITEEIGHIAIFEDCEGNHVGLHSMG